MTIQNEPIHALEGVLSEANGDRSRENVTLISGQDLPAMAVLGQITSGGKWTQVITGAGDGSETAKGILLYATDASGGDTEVVILRRDAVVRRGALQFEAAETSGEIDTHVANLEAQNIQVRDGV